MTPTELQNRCKALAAHIGPKAKVSIFISEYHTPFLSVEPTGNYLNDKTKFTVEGCDWERLFADAYAKWDEVSGTYAAKMVRDMALAIIRITADLGKCSDAALRMDFSVEDIKRFGAEAVADANQIAANGPFSIAETGNGNGAPAEVADRTPSRAEA